MSLSGEPVVILGTFRGGTSCLSTALVAMGLYMGEPSAFKEANQFNQSGFWEHEDLVAFNQRTRVAYNQIYLGVDHMPEDWRERPGSEMFLAELEAILEKNFQGHSIWGWKEPATTNLFPLYKAALEKANVRARYPIVVRHPLSVALSRQRQFLIKNDDGMGGAQNLLPPDEQRALGLWVDYMLANLRETKGSPRYVISYEDLLEDPRKNLEGLAEMILPWDVTPEQLQAGVDTINPEYSHSSFSVDDLKPWPTIVARTYDLCLRAAQDNVALNEGKFDDEVEALWQEWQTMSNMARSLQMPVGRMAFAWREGEELKHRAIAYTPSGGWQTVRGVVSGAPGSVVQITLYHMTCQVWIRRVIWRIGDQELPAPLQQGPNGILEKVGLLRLYSFGAGALTTKMPDVPGEAELEIEFLMQFDLASVNAASVMLKQRMDAARRPQAAATGRWP